VFLLGLCRIAVLRMNEQTLLHAPTHRRRCAGVLCEVSILPALQRLALWQKRRRAHKERHTAVLLAIRS
jgi:hypothetical protein